MAWCAGLNSAPFAWLLPLLLLLAAAWDLWRMEIPNTLCALLAVGFLANALLAGLPWPALLLQFGIGAGVLALTVIMFSFKLFGGGDGKLLSATVLWYAPAALPTLVLAMALIGGALTLVLLLWRRRPLSPGLARHRWLSRLHSRDSGVPYAPAIAGGALVALPDLAWRTPIL